MNHAFLSVRTELISNNEIRSYNTVLVLDFVFIWSEASYCGELVLQTSHFTGGDEGVICDITVITVREKRGAAVNRSTTVRVMRDRGGVYRFDAGYDEYAYIRCNHAVILVQYGISGE